MLSNPNDRFARRDTFRRGGFSLLEVAIALVIFVIGALAIVRIFPGALTVVQGSGNRNLAVNLNRGLHSKFAQEVGSVARAIYNGTTNDASATNDATWVDFNGSVAGTPRRNYTLPRSNIADIDQSALGKYQYVFEEGQKVRGVSTPTIELFLLSNHSIRPGSTVVVSEEDMVEGVRVETDGTLNFTDARFRNADISLSNGTPIPMPSFYGDTNPSDIDYYVTYRYKKDLGGTSEKRVQTEDEEYIGNTSSWGTAPRVARTTDVIAGQVEVRFVRKIALPPTSAESLLVGHVALDSSTMLLTKGRNIRPNDNLRVSYVVDSWNWLMNDEVHTQPQDSGGLAAVLPVKFIDDEPASFYPLPTQRGAAYGIRQSYNASTGALVMETGNYAEGGTATPIFQGASAKNLRDNFNAGRILLTEVPKSDGTNSNTSPSLRVAYRTRDAWAQQVSVAPSAYTRYPSPTANPAQPRQEWREYCVGTDNYLYFHPSEAGKTLSISYKYGVVTAPAASDQELNARIVTIDEEIINLPPTIPPTIPPAFAPDGRVARAQLTDINGNLLAVPLTAITSIRGLSVQIRTAWLEGPRFTQSSLTGYRQETDSQ